MNEEDVELNVLYKSTNPIATDCEYEVIKKNRNSCDVKLWDSGEETDTIYEGIKYYHLIESVKGSINLRDKLMSLDNNKARRKLLYKWVQISMVSLEDFEKLIYYIK